MQAGTRRRPTASPVKTVLAGSRHQEVNITTHRYRVPISEISAVLSPLPHNASCDVAKCTACLTALFYILLTVRHVMILGKWPTWHTILFHVFVLFLTLYMFPAHRAYHQERQIVSCAGRKFTFDLHTTRPPIQGDNYQRLCWQFVSVLETCRELKIKWIHRKELCVTLVIYQELLLPFVWIQTCACIVSAADMRTAFADGWPTSLQPVRGTLCTTLQLQRPLNRT
jgi:hypothetical protein